MKKSIKFKTLVVVLLIVSMFSATMVANAGTVGFGEVGIPYLSDFCVKDTADGCSDLTIGYSFYTSVNAQTYSHTTGGLLIESCPVTNCYYYDTTYLGQYVTVNPYVKQKICLSVMKFHESANPYTAEIEEWDYH